MVRTRNSVISRVGTGQIRVIGLGEACNFGAGWVMGWGLVPLAWPVLALSLWTRFSLESPCVLSLGRAECEGPDTQAQRCC